MSEPSCEILSNILLVILYSLPSTFIVILALFKLSSLFELISISEPEFVTFIEPTVIEVSCNQRLNPVNIVTQPYPGFPTDLQAIAMAMLTTAEGVSIVTESLYENRFMQVPELRRMGADIHQERNHALIRGVERLTGANVKASDLRAGASLIIAALMAEGESDIEALHHIDRGYELFETKFANLGANIVRYNDESDILTKNIAEVTNKGSINASI